MPPVIIGVSMWSQIVLHRLRAIGALWRHARIRVKIGAAPQLTKVALPPLVDALQDRTYILRDV